ncbi:hypothetical protein [Methylocaldum sp.]|uniref:hypothetical protein n=1 Tax=Methylocaldum sp. TaxID=1969727 RepID=UPI002D3BF23F|nr:hypothetical protein [Methylocaldum sp.]HYE35473.1 hypothetical protein [Methylocaldum sp.]
MSKLSRVRISLLGAIGFLVIGTIGLMSGCSAVNQVQGYLGEAVTLYCSQPADQRAGIRSAVNAKAFPNAVKIDCAQDQAAPAPSTTPAPGGTPPDGPAALLDRRAPSIPTGVHVADGRPPGSDCMACHQSDPGDDPGPVPA